MVPSGQFCDVLGVFAMGFRVGRGGGECAEIYVVRSLSRCSRKTRAVGLGLGW